MTQDEYDELLRRMTTAVEGINATLALATARARRELREDLRHVLDEHL